MLIPKEFFGQEDELRGGDVLVVWKRDHLWQSLKDLLHILEKIAAAGAGFRSLTEHIGYDDSGWTNDAPNAGCFRGVRAINDQWSERAVEAARWFDFHRSTISALGC